MVDERKGEKNEAASARFDDVETSMRQRSERPPRSQPTFVLSVTDGPDRGAALRLDGSQPSRMLVGKSPACDLKLTDIEVSRRHFALDLDGDSVQITDLDSTNGTVVNGVIVREGRLLGGETIRVGTSTLRLETSETGNDVPLSNETRFGRLVGASVAMRRLYPLCHKIAKSNVPVVIEGETGTGKELLAESIHELGLRPNGPFVVFDCTAVPANLMESALFGHERGSFTGATEMRRGVFEQADGGTLLIDEIGDLDLPLQAKLLRAIERSEVRRVGGDKWIKADVRVIAATRRDLDHEVQAGRFRDDLFFRLAVTRAELPPLRRRYGDVTLLTEHFWDHLSRGEKEPIPPQLTQQFEEYSWPGNVRELYNAVARRLVLGDMATVESLRTAPPVADTGDFIARLLAMNLPLAEARERLMTEFRGRYVEHVLARHGGNVARAAAASGVARRYFQIMKARKRDGT